MQLATAFEEGGLRDRSGSFQYKDHLGKTNVPVLAIAGDQDLICPPEAVYGSSLFHLVCMHLLLALNFEVILTFLSGDDDFMDQIQ